ncbi:MAG: hypothetical protein DUD26_06715 [Eubacteriaceae bacterium]|uniref:Uncharacterized protein n=1 Tax=Candidatus Pseudoramibacter fermentans TaxID=2594427 RepID=A0A6L5GP94_9FIRM|nr:hypothetical protein [Candidatus Pseudoramibacter fermentans]RRF92457.1 MAG: hypothetical protein DUD26_06715 [Eubacteriaceae bacterium]
MKTFKKQSYKKTKNVRKWVALFLTLAMVATSGLITTAQNLFGADEDVYNAAQEQAQTVAADSAAANSTAAAPSASTDSAENNAAAAQSTPPQSAASASEPAAATSNAASTSSSQAQSVSASAPASSDQTADSSSQTVDVPSIEVDIPQAEEEADKKPAQSFSRTAGNGVTVHVSAPEGALPENSSMSVSAVSTGTAKSIAKSTASGEVKDAVGVNITFHNQDGAEIEPEASVSVSMSLSHRLDGDRFAVSHQTDSGNVTAVSASASASGASFSGSSFSIYVISGVGTSEESPAVATYQFHDLSGSVIDTQKVKTGDTLKKPASPEKDGYKFIGWARSKDAKTADFDGFGTVTVSAVETVNLYPVFKEVHYVFFMDSAGSDAKVSTTKEGINGDTIATSGVKLPLSSTESVTGWYTDPALTHPVGDSVTLGTENIKLYPKIEKGHYLYFDAKGGTYIEPQFVKADGQTKEPAAPKRAGYTFKGWSASESAQVATYTFGGGLTEDTTIYAVWEAKKDTQYTVIYWWENANDSGYSYHESTAKKGQSGATVSTSALAKTYDGFTLNTDKTKKSVTIAGDGSTIVNIYYARNTYSIQFYKAERKGTWFVHYEWSELTGLRITAKYGADIAVKWPSATSKIWGTKKGENGQGDAPYQSGIATMPLDGGAFYYVSQNGRITLNLNYYVEGLDGKYTLDHTDSFKSNNTEWSTTAEDHYDIAGFTYTNNVKDGSKFEQVTPYTYKVDFKYSRNTYDINFINGDNKRSESYKYGADISGVDLKTAPERPSGVPEGYTFAGWYDNELGAGDPVTLSGTMPAKNITLYAKWEAPEVSGKAYLAIHGGDSISLKVEYGGTIDEGAMPTVVDSEGNVLQNGSSQKVTVPEGYDWKGWATKSGDSYTLYNFNTKVHGDVELYPYYVSNGKYQVQYSAGDGKGSASDSKWYAIDAKADIQSAKGITAPTGKVFLYWQSETGDAYYPGDKITITEANAKGDHIITLTAVYGDKTATTSLTYYSNYPDDAMGTDGSAKAQQTANGGTNLDNNTRLTALTLAGAKFEAPLNYTFDGWQDGDGKDVAAGAEILVDNIGDNKLYAKWKPVPKIKITVKPADKSKTYDGTALKADSYTITDGALADGDTLTVTYSGSQTNVGTATSQIASIKVTRGSVDVTRLYDITKATGSLTVKAKEVTVKADDKTKTYGTADPSLTVSVSGTINGDRITHSISREDGEAVGTYTITPSGDENQGNYKVKYETGTLTITKAATMTVTASGYTGVYDGESHAASASASVTDGTTIYYKVDGGEWTTEAPSIKNVGEKTVSVKAENANYETATAKATLKVTPKAVTVTADNQTKNYGEADPVLTAKVEGTLNGDKVDYKLSREKGEKVGTYAITPEGDAEQGNYTVTYKPGTLTIVKAGTLSVTATGYTGVYDGESHAVSASASVTDGTTIYYKVDGGDWTTEAPSIKDVGTKTVSVKAENANYETAETSATLTVTKRTVIITSGSAEKEYDGTALTNDTITITGDGIVGDEIKNIRATGSITEVGHKFNKIEYDLTSEHYKDGNYSIILKAGTLTVTKNATAQIDVTAHDAKKAYDGTALTQSGYSITGLPEGFTAEVTTKGSITNVGTADNAVDKVVIKKDGKDVTDYFTRITKTKGTLTVTKREVTLTSESASKVYDGTALTKPDVSITGSFVDGEVTGIKATGSITKVGEVTNTISYTTQPGFDEKNYTITIKEGKLKVTKVPATTASVSVTADSSSWTYDGKTHSDDGYTAAGLPDDYKEKGFSVTATVEGTIKNAGTADNTVKSAAIVYKGEDVTDQFEAPITKNNGTLTVAPRSVTVESASDSKVFDGKPLTNSKVTIGGDGFVDGEVKVTAIGSITKAGSTANTIEYQNLGSFNKANYSIKETLGTLTVTKKANAVTITAKTADKPYDGTALTAGYDWTAPEGYTVTAQTDGSITDAGKTANKIASYQILDADGNDVTDQFEGVTVSDGTLKVTKRQVTLTSASATKEYDGTALTRPDVTVGGDGFVDDEVSDIKATGSITEAGSVKNSIAYTKGDGFKDSNYDITKTEGDLVVKANQTAAIVVTAPTDSKLYDGTALTAGAATVTGLPKGFSGTANAAGTITDAGTATATVDQDSVKITKDGADVTRNFANITYKEGKLTVNPRTVTLTSDSASRAYNGEALTRPDVTVGGDGFVSGEVSKIKAIGTITEIGQVDNTITYTTGGGFKAKNYKITKHEGQLAITANTTAITIKADDAEKVYDGKALTESGYTITGLPSGFEAQVVTEGSITKAGNAVNTVKTAVIKKDGRNVTSQFSGITLQNGTLVVKPRPVTVESASDAKVFDGKPLTNSKVTIGGQGFVDGEVKVTATGSITKAGSTANTIEYQNLGGFDKNNYSIEETLGTLTVKKHANAVTITAKTGDKVYDGTALTAGYDWTAPDGYTVIADTKGSITDAGKTANKIASYKILDADGSDVTDQFEGVEINEGTLTVTKRQVTLTSDTVEREYDGTALTSPVVTIGGDGFVAGEVSDIKATGSITEAGSVKNTIAYTKQGKFKADNYDITINEGTLTIKKNTTARISVTAPSASKVYDGTALTAGKAVFSGLPAGFEGSAATDGTITNAGTAKASVNRVRITKDGRDVTDQFTNVTINNGTLTVTKRPVTLTSASYTRAYNGSELTRPNVTVGGKGFVDGEVSGLRATGAITKTGSVKNTIVYTRNSGFRESNYDITVNEGTLTITQVPAQTASVVFTAASGTWTYDGQAHGTGDFTVTGLDNMPEGFTGEASLRGSVTNVKDGVVANQFTRYAVMYKGEDVTDQFESVTAREGTLQITPRPVTLTSESGTHVYDGKAFTKPDVTIGGQGFVKGEATAKATGSITKVGSAANTIEIRGGLKYDEANYTIEKHEGTLTVTKHEGTIVISAESATRPYNGKALTAGYTATAPDGYTVTADIEGSITNAGKAANKVKSYKILNADGEDVTDQFDENKITVNDGTLEVTPKAVKLSSGSAKKEYDGAALTSPAVTGGEDFVAGEVSNLRATGSITDVGTTANTIAYDTNDSFKKGNYRIEMQEGELEVTKNTTAAIRVTAGSADKTYDGTALTAGAAKVTGLPTGFSGTAKATGSITDAGRADATVDRSTLTITKDGKDVTDFFANIAYEKGTLRVNPRAITLTSGSASKAYDRTPLTNSDMTVTGDGFVKGEGFSYIFLGSQTERGESPNTFRYEAQPGTNVANYDITTEYGTLRVDAPVLYIATIHYQDANGNTLAPDYIGQYMAGDSFNIASPTLPGYTARQTYVVMASMPERDVEVTVVYDRSTVPVTPVNPVVPGTPTTPARPATPAVPAAPGIPTTTNRFFTIPGNAAVPGTTPGGAAVVPGDNGDTLQDLDDVKTPKGLQEDLEACNILPFLFMLLTMIVVILYTKMMKDDQQEIFDLTEELEDKKRQ